MARFKQSKIKPPHQKITDNDLMIFIQQFTTLLCAGIAIVKIFDLLEKCQNHHAIRLLIYSLKRELSSGKTLFTAFYQHVDIFTEFTCQLIRIGEETGKIEIMFKTITEHHEKKLQLKNKIKKSLFYPIIVILFALIVTLSMFIFIIPRFAELFNEMHIPLPVITACLFYLSKLLCDYSLIIILMLVLIIFLSFKLKIQHQIKTSITDIFYSLPFIKQTIKKIIIVRFARNLSIILSAGMPIPEGLKLISQAEKESEFKKIIIQLRHKINAGSSLYLSFESIPYFPKLIVQMIKTGEESGSLDLMLNKIALFYESEIDRWISQLNHLVEPLIILILGVLIGGLVIGMYLPIFQLGNAL